MAQFPSDIFSPESQEQPMSEGHMVTLSSHIQQMSKRQDQTYDGNAVDEFTGENFQYGMVTDGHGGEDCIRFLRSLSKQLIASILGKVNPVETMAELVNKNVRGSYCGGATMCLAKVYTNRIECINSGDSRVAVYKNGELVYLSKEHNWTNQEERVRLLIKGGIYFSPSTNIKVINKTQMVGQYSEYAKWESDNSMLACTQAIGSNGKTGYAPHHEIIPIMPGDTYKVVIGSDGLWDMIIDEDIKDLASMNAEEGVSFAVARWRQEWDMQPMGEKGFVKGSYTDYQCDDVCMVAIDITPN